MIEISKEELAIEADKSRFILSLLYLSFNGDIVDYIDENITDKNAKLKRKGSGETWHKKFYCTFNVNNKVLELKISDKKDSEYIFDGDILINKTESGGEVKLEKYGNIFVDSGFDWDLWTPLGLADPTDGKNENNCYISTKHTFKDKCIYATFDKKKFEKL